jgi:hypothetical protein
MVALLVLLPLALATAPARGGPPFVTNDADPPDLHQLEVNMPFTRKLSAAGGASGEIVTIDVNYGADRYTQVSVETPFPYVTDPSGSTQAGAGDVLLEYKRRFGLDDRRGYFGVNPQLTLPTGDTARGLSAGRATLQLPVLYQRRYGRTLLYQDLRYRYRAGDEGKSFWFLGTAFESRILPRLELGAEVFATTAAAPGGSGNCGFNVGGKYVLKKGLKVMFSVGRSLEGDPESTLFLGLKVLSPP